MCNLSTAIERKGIVKATVKVYRRGRITAEEAASDLGMTVDGFLEKVKSCEEETSEKE